MESRITYLHNLVNTIEWCMINSYLHLTAGYLTDVIKKRSILSVDAQDEEKFMHVGS